MERILDAARFARRLPTELPKTQAAIGLRESFVAAIDSLERATTSASVWPPLKSFAALHGFDYMFVLKGREHLARSIASAVARP